MARIEGKYILDHNENLVSYLTQLGFPEDKALKADEIKPQLDIRMEGNKYIMSSNSGIKNSSSSFTINTEYDDPMPTGEILKSIATLEGNKITIRSKASDGRSGVRTYEFSDRGFELTLSSTISPVIAKRIYRRLES